MALLRILLKRGDCVTKAEKTVRYGGVALGELFALGTVIWLFQTGQTDRLPMGFGTMVLVLLPAILERLFSCKCSLPVYVFGLLYAIGPMLGQCYNFYYTVFWWDKLLHISGGVMFAILGLFLFDCMNHGQKNLLLCAMFALLFSMAIALAWEFVEFGSDRLLHTDMQDDTVITALYSYMLDEGVGVAGSIENIGSVVIDGTPLPVNGYIDIGLIDTMMDMLLESLGGLAVCAVYLIDRGNHPMIRRIDPANTARFGRERKMSV